MRTHHSLGSSGSERFAAPSLRSGVSMRKPLLPYLERRCVMRRIIVPVILALVVAALAAAAAFAVDSTTSFKIVRSQKAATDNDCLKGAEAQVDVRTTPTDNQIMAITLKNAPQNTEFELFVTQQPNSPCGVSWYQADFTTNIHGNGEVRARGIFSEELFVLAPGSVKAPQVDEPEVAKVFAELKSVRKGRRQQRWFRFVDNHGTSPKACLCKLVGWYARNPRLRSQEAYRVVMERMWHLVL